MSISGSIYREFGALAPENCIAHLWLSRCAGCGWSSGALELDRAASIGGFNETGFPRWLRGFVTHDREFGRKIRVMTAIGEGGH